MLGFFAKLSLVKTLVTLFPLSACLLRFDNKAGFIWWRLMIWACISLSEVTDLLDFGRQVSFNDFIHCRLELVQALTLWRTKTVTHVQPLWPAITCNHMLCLKLTEGGSRLQQNKHLEVFTEVIKEAQLHELLQKDLANVSLLLLSYMKQHIHLTTDEKRRWEVGGVCMCHRAV